MAEQKPATKFKKPFNRTRNIDELLRDEPKSGPSELGQAFLDATRPKSQRVAEQSVPEVRSSLTEKPSSPSEVAVPTPELRQSGQTNDAGEDGVMLPLSKIIENPKLQPRLRIDEDHVVSLSEKFARSGQLNAILVRPVDGNEDLYEIIGGNHRFRAARRLGWTEIRVNIKRVTFDAARIMCVDDNDSLLPRSDYEKALSYRALLDDGIVKSQQELADQFGVSKGRISQCLAFTDLPLPVLDILDDHPDLFTYRTAIELKKTLQAHVDDTGKALPGVVENITAGVMRLVDSDAPLSGLMHWIDQRLSGKALFVSTVEPRIVLDREGRTAFKTKGKDRSIVVEWDKKISFTSEQVQEALMSALRSLAERGPETEDDK